MLELHVLLDGQTYYVEHSTTDVLSHGDALIYIANRLVHELCAHYALINMKPHLPREVWGFDFLDV